MAEALAVHDLSVRLSGRSVLSRISLSASFGEILAVLGPNGAGKSTLLRAMVGLARCTGEVRCEGELVSELAPATRARRLSFVPQQSQLGAGLMVHEVIALGRYAHRALLARTRPDDEQAIEAAARATDVLALVERPFSELSSGEQKRVLLARALCTGARTLLLDEPTATLDIEHALRLFALLRTLAARGHAIVIVLHQIEHALEFAERALLLARGQLVALGPTRAVLTPEHVRAVYGVELVPDAAPRFRLWGEEP